MNKDLEAFYKNPSYDLAAKTSIDSMVANNIRKSLDGAIETLNEPGYQHLKTNMVH